MLKFSKYFIILFLISAILPLFLMFSWHQYQEKHLKKDKEQRIFSIGFKQLNFTSKNYLKVRENNILRVIENTPIKDISLKQLKNILEVKQVSWIAANKDFVVKNLNQYERITAYYDLTENQDNKKPELSAVYIVPFKKVDISGIKIVYKVDIKELFPAGPFDMELYSGDKINKNNLLETVKDPFSPPFLLKENKKRLPENELTGIPKNKNIPHDVIKLTDYRGKTIASILLKRHNPPPGPWIAPEKLGMIILFTGALFSLFIGLYLNNNFIKPLLTLSNALNKLQQGELLSQLNTNIAQKELQHAFESFNKVVTGLKEKEEIRNSFISNLTHDLRTPLIAQEKTLELISKEFEELGLKDSFELAKNLEKNNSHILRMVNLILEAYRFDLKDLKLTMTKINLYDVVENCFEQLQILAQEKNICLINQIPNDFPFIVADQNSLNRIFLNLVSNSIENISDEGKVLISVDSYEKFININIEDNGNGILQEDIEHIFDRYFTGKSYERKIGSGLGLFVCKELIRLHNGEISVQSEKDKYTRFIIKLPTKFEENWI
ncbi:MAG: HAMP domain-containing sensor histidine kinase [bacterium]